MKVVTSTARVLKHRERMARSQSNRMQALMKVAELAYLRHKQQEIFTKLFVGRIERLLLVHPKYIRKFDLLLKDANSDIRLRNKAA